mmetsp:Transcript_4617/g.13956  ORF Transcript_4617/g.13956 Transcript_4617/m.13956 type:complete len:1120 (-) Transcript_4617:130-3489(-)|eukprot:CAMPEP_0198731540 /NCGR_PEP_ID=MMETSP1475-20131203/30553_1 /TAXON_ID= ORGANISM="Unidentified sp., Strain CCMP1999" /NCGR_SAMPLE_ID=MMETSP1475 /ASSEMBLY_ACC=CAM_ASM_001111 /LENGTH=1119 /DNA_ID=CAMNT_0044494515 /DNA_START=29 /DNA_END=3388 /DNA_ORIENTATION=-
MPDVRKLGREKGRLIQDAFANVCASYGRICTTKWSFLLIATGIALAAFLIAGISRVEMLEELTDLWVDEGTRLQGERAEFNAKFGGLPREGVLAISSRDKSSEEDIKTRLEALLAVTSPILGADEAEGTAGSHLTLNYQLPNGKTAEFSEEDFCQKPPVPKVLRPLDGIADEIFSVTYQRMTDCLADNDALVDPDSGDSIDPLAYNWGVNEFPCIRTTVLDCFAEGSFDYPSSLQELSRVSGAVLAAKDREESGDGPRTYSQCLDLVQRELKPAISVALPDADSNILDLIIESVNETIVPMFFTWGYRWRPSFREMSNEQIIEHLDSAVKNAEDSSLDPLDCARNKLACCPLWNGVNVDTKTFMSDFSQTDDGSITNVGVFRTAWLNNNQEESFLAARLAELGLTDNEQRLNLVLAWEQRLIDYYLPRYQAVPFSKFGPDEEFSSTKLDFIMSRSSSDVVEEGNSVPWSLLGGAYAIMVAYAVLVFFDWRFPLSAKNFVQSRVMIAILGIVIITAASAGGFGVMGWAQVKLSPISTNLLPFLALGVGLDDMFVVLNALIRPEIEATQALTAERVVAEAMRIAGPSVVLTSLSIIVAFLISAIVRIQAIYVFCYQVAATVAFNLTFLFLLFIPLAALDTKRVLAGRLECLPCIRTSEGAGSEPTQATMSEATVYKRHQNISDRLSQFGEFVLGPKILLRNMWTKVATVVVFLSFFVAMLVCGIVLSRSGLPLRDVALSDSYQRSYVDLQESFFTSYASYIVHSEETEDFSSEEVQSAMLQQQMAVQSASHVSRNPSVRDTSWFADSQFSFLAFFNGREGVEPIATPIPSEKYYGGLAQWASTSGLSFTGDTWCYNGTLDEPAGSRTRISCSADGASGLSTLGSAPADVRLASSRQTFIQRDLVETNDFVDAIESSRQQCDAWNVNGNKAFVYGFIYEFWEQYVNIWTNLYKVVGFALLGVFIIVLLFLLSLRVSIIICGLILLVVVDLFGLMTLVGVKVNAVSITNYAVAVGIAVEFLAHYSHAYLHVADLSRDQRAVHALKIMFAPSTNGYLSTVLALLVVVGNRFPFVRKYYFGMLFSMVTLSYLHGMLLLPVLLSLFGPRHDVKEVTASTNTSSEVS